MTPYLSGLKQLDDTSYMDEINILGLNDVSWWQGFLHIGQFFLSALLQPHIWGVTESFEAIVVSLALIHYEHMVLVVSDDTVPPQISIS